MKINDSEPKPLNFFLLKYISFKINGILVNFNFKHNRSIILDENDNWDNFYKQLINSSGKTLNIVFEN